MKRSIITAALFVVSLVAGCDMCVTSIEIHHARCNDGDQASCEWLADNVVGAYCKS